MPWPSSAYVVSMWYIFHYNYVISLKQAPLFFIRFLEYLILVLDDNMDEEME